MSERRRALPAWMEKKEEKVEEPLKSKRKRKAERSAFYCMNEEELVEAAVSCLTSGDCEDAPLRTHQQVDQKAADTGKKKRGKPATSHMTAEPLAEESSDCGDDLDMTYVSETDLDITEVETVPYTTTPQHPGSGGQRSEPVKDPVDVEAEKRKEQPQEDDALRLVREIFFT